MVGRPHAGRTELALGILVAVAINLLWILPPAGVVACAVAFVLVPPWGRTLAERGVITMLVLLGIVAIAVPRASTVPLTPATAHIGLAVFTAILMALRFVPRWQAPVPRPTWSDGVIGLFAVGGVAWLLSAYVGRAPHEVLSGLFFSGWDNQGHFTPFANTYQAGATLWPTIDGSVAWNQWYPSLHSTLWTLAQLAAQPTGVVLDRVELLWPYVVWTAVSFTLSLAALAWVASDLAARAVRLRRRAGRWYTTLTPALAVVAFAVFATFGSPAWLYNYGFTNFVMAVAITTATAYLSARSWRSARTLGWLLIPLGALAINGLWTPLVLGILPSALIVLAALWRVRWWLAPLWALVSAVVVGGTVLLQSRAIAEVAPGQTGSFLSDLGAIGIGMAPFNIGAAMAAPVIAVLVAVVLLRGRSTPLAVAVAGSSVGIAVFLGVTMYAASLAEVGKLYSYYVLKTLDALLLSNAPLLAALAAVVGAIGIHAVRRHVDEAADRRLVNRPNAVIVTVGALVFGATMFGYVGPRPTEFAPGFSGSPGIEAATVRAQGIADPLVGEAIVEAQRAARAHPELTTMLWDGSGTLPNLWLASLHANLSVDQHEFYKNLPAFPYDDKAVQYVEFSLGVNHDLDLAVLYFRGVSGDQLAPLAARNPDRVTVVKVPMRSSPLCLECSL